MRKTKSRDTELYKQLGNTRLIRKAQVRLIWAERRQDGRRWAWRRTMVNFMASLLNSCSFLFSCSVSRTPFSMMASMSSFVTVPDCTARRTTSIYWQIPSVSIVLRTHVSALGLLAAQID